jgi:signal transduction histidine kinase
MRNDLIILGALMLGASMILGTLFAKQITIPIDRLKQAALKIAKGRFETPIQPLSGDELGFLAHTMEDMRQAIVQRDIRHKAMLAGVAHEIRNPLGGIELFAGLLASDVEDPEVKQQAQKIQQEVRNLNRIVTDFIDYARPNKAQRKTVLLKDMLDDVASVLQPVTGNVTISNNLDSGTCVNADPQHLRQIFLNLFQNALEANEAFDKHIYLAGKKHRFQQHIYVWDNGPGIPDEHVQQIFEPFYTSKKEGTGLGLAIVQSLLFENNGSIILEQPGRAKFLITLDAEAANPINQS